jgi:hypothetical protein
MCAEELRLPPGYRLDRSDPDLWRCAGPRVGWWPISVLEEPLGRP